MSIFTLCLVVIHLCLLVGLFMASIENKWNGLTVLFGYLIVSFTWIITHI